MLNKSLKVDHSQYDFEEMIPEAFSFITLTQNRCTTTHNNHKIFPLSKIRQNHMHP